jgi:hypothetical protein
MMLMRLNAALEWISMRHKSGILQRIEAKAKEIEDSLSAYDFKLDHCVRVIVANGSEFIFKSAFVLKYEDWYMVFAEHDDFKCFAIEDLQQIYQFQMLSSKIQDASKFKPVRKIDGKSLKC